MEANEIAIICGGVSSVLAVLIYFTKNIKESSCCGSKCRQVVLDNDGKAIKSASIVV
jgi:hypothetical protein